MRGKRSMGVRSFMCRHGGMTTKGSFRSPIYKGKYTRSFGCGDWKTGGSFLSAGREMERKERTVRHSDEELTAMGERGQSHSDWAKAAAMTSDEIEASVTSDPDEAGMVMDWDSVTVAMPQPKAVLNMRVDREVLDYFRDTGRGSQTRITAVLKSHVARMRHDQH
jgi:uncharacterized protein (DUF4415 family)